MLHITNDPPVGQDDFEPTPRAISEHIFQLKKTNGGGGKSKATTTSTPIRAAINKTPSKKTTAPKTPTTSGKRKRTSMSEEDDDSEDERSMLKSSPLGARSSVSRRSKSAKPSYAEADADDEAVADTPIEELRFFDGTNEVEQIGQGIEQVGFRLPNAVVNGKIGSHGGFMGAKAKRVKAEVQAEVEAGESDVSDFQPGFGF